jgi:peptidoglycan/LPS O-acetylase OafA/YrhL
MCIARRGRAPNRRNVEIRAMTAVELAHERRATAPPSMPPSGAAGRLHALDALRAVALVLGVVLHAGLSYLPGSAAWVLMDGDRSTVLAVLMYVIHQFRMMLFFVLAGLFARRTYERRGARGFAADRLRRIGLPLLLTLLPMLGLIAVLAGWAGAVARAHGLAAPAQTVPQLSASTFPLAHLWFLYLLLLFYGAALASSAGLPAAAARHVDRALPRLLSAPGALVLAAPLAASLASDPDWAMWWGIPTPDHGLVPKPSAFAGYGLAFAAGWALLRHAGLLAVLRRHWAANLAAAVLTASACLAIAGPTPDCVPGEGAALRTAYAGLYAAAAWLWTFAALGAALRFLDRPSRRGRYLADASYWIYLVHLPLVMALQIAFACLSWPWQLEFPLLLACAFAPMLAAYHWGVRRTWIGGLLNGKRIGTARV